MKLTPAYIIIILTVFMASCSSTRLSTHSAFNGPVIELYKGACFGTCPIYRISYYEDGTLLYEGRRFTDRQGFHVRMATDKEKRAIQQNVEHMKWTAYEAYYESQLPDLSMSVIKKGSFTTKFKEEAPLELQVMGKLLEKIAESGHWEKISSYTDEEPPTSNHLVIKTRKDHDPQDILDDLSFTSVEINKQVSDHMATWLLNYDSQEVSPGQLYFALISHPDVEMVEFDVQLRLREE